MHLVVLATEVLHQLPWRLRVALQEALHTKPAAEIGLRCSLLAYNFQADVLAFNDAHVCTSAWKRPLFLLNASIEIPGYI